MENWLGPNRRALRLGMLVPALVALASAAVALGAVSAALPLRVLAALLAVVSGIVLLALAWQLRLPRIGYRDGEVLLYLKSSGPIAVPVELVEGFLLGQAPTLRAGQREEQTRAVVLRIAEKADGWQNRDVKPALGSWCQGYVTIRGTWCEPLSTERVVQLNRRLAAAQRTRRSAR